MGEDITPLFEASTIPMELLTDSAHWIYAPDVEAFLENVQNLPLRKKDLGLIEKIGHEVPYLKSWGVLDSVLRMMPKVKEVFQQPDRFLSYFISPEPPVENINRTENSISFAIPLPAEQYPLTARFLKSAFESLTVFNGQGLSLCEWQDINIKINWSQAQSGLFKEDPGHQISPELLNSVVEELQRGQKDLEEKNRELQRRNEELLQAQKEIENKFGHHHVRQNQESQQELLNLALKIESTTETQQMHGNLQLVNQNLARLHDYMVRAHQLVTLLSAQNKNAAGTKEALRRVDWDYVKTQYPKIILESIETVRQFRKENKNV